ncbi:MAG: hypothetical protein GF341_08030 [candidate division Zixibacteria bacterium]|nr:hypothetical protein [candidate division Zixibacteria bacterium]
MLRKALQQQQATIATQWIDRVVNSFPEGSHEFLKAQTDRFRNPIGHALRTELPVLLSHITDDTPVESIHDSMGRLIRILAVQEWSPSDALGFVFALKTVIREVLSDSLNYGVNADEAVVIEQRIDRMALAAFEEYIACRERLAEIRVQCERRRVGKLLERLGDPICES